MSINFKNANFAKSTLGANITDVATSLTVASAGDAALFPATGTMRCVIWGGSYAFPSQDTTREIITMTFSATVTFSPVVRARESTVAKAWVTGDNIALVITAGKIDEIEAEITGNIDQSVKQAASPTFVGATLSGATASLPVFTGASKELVSKSVADTNVALGLTRIGFKANKNGTEQTALTLSDYTKITFTNEIFDLGGLYDAANSKWVPPVGYVRLTAQVAITTNILETDTIQIVIYKNNAVLAVNSFVSVSTNTVFIQGQTLDYANGTDYYEVFVYTNGAGAKNCSGNISYSFFCGEII